MGVKVLSSFSVAIVDDHPIFRKGVAALVKEIGFGTILEGKSGDDAVNIARDNAPDIMLLDLDMPRGGVECVGKVNSVSAHTKCVLLTASNCPQNAIKSLEAGARGYILKGVGWNELVDAIHTILDDETYVSPVFATSLLAAAQSRASNAEVQLTAREQQVLRQLEEGRTNREIAERLDITEKTVKFYMTNIMQKFGVKNRVAAVMEFQRMYGVSSLAQGALARRS